MLQRVAGRPCTTGIWYYLTMSYDACGCLFSSASPCSWPAAARYSDVPPHRGGYFASPNDEPSNNVVFLPPNRPKTAALNRATAAGGAARRSSDVGPVRDRAQSPRAARKRASSNFQPSHVRSSAVR